MMPDSNRDRRIYDINTGQQLFKLNAPDGAEGDNFGGSVAILNDTAIVGSFLDDGVASSTGSAYLFDVSTGQQRFKLTASDAEAFDVFGSAVALSGDFAAA